MSNRVAVIVPVYNTSQYLKRCLDSIIYQSYNNLEIILIDDGSNDGSLDISLSYQKSDNRIKVYSKVNGGQSSARNLGLDISDSEYITFIDSDDYVDKDYIKILINNLIKYDADISCCKEFSHKCEKESIKNNDNNIVVFDNFEALNRIVDNNIITHSVWGKMFKRIIFKELRFREGIIFEDMDIIYKLLFKSKTIIFQNISLYHYTINFNGTINSSFKLKFIDEFFVKSEMYRFYNFHNFISANKVYLDLYFVGLRLYSKLYKTHREIILQYNYLLDFDVHKINLILKQHKVSFKRRIIHIIYKINKTLFLKVVNLIGGK